LPSNPDIYHPEYVAGLFDRMSRTYGVANYLTSFGFTERWRRQCVAGIDWSGELKFGYDLMSGMGEIWESVVARAAPGTIIRGVDLSPEMNAGAARQVERYSNWDLAVMQADALHSDIADASADFIVSSFGLKTFSDNQLVRLARETARILRPGGQFSFVEIARPPGLLRLPFMFYLKRMVPVLGRWVMKDAEAYRMLGEYTDRHGDAGNFAAALRAAGMEAEHRRLFFGCACLVRGENPVG
jgi:demethylmenaquinone methyltransferase/2-methoxy-6-polyprenyl-1,4-benzoquinol methylase